MRPIPLGRNNRLFAGSDAGGERAAAIYSLTETAKLNGLDPENYLRQVLERIADHPVKRVHELLAWTSPRSGQGWISEMLPEGDCSRVCKRLQVVLTGQLLLPGSFSKLYRTGLFLANGELLMRDYPRKTPTCEQVDLVASMNIENGLIVHHRVYWGWKGFKTLQTARERPGD